MLTKLERQLADALRIRINTIFEVQGPFLLQSENKFYSAEYYCPFHFKIYEQDGSVPLLYVEIKLTGKV